MDSDSRSVVPPVPTTRSPPTSTVVTTSSEPGDTSIHISHSDSLLLGTSYPSSNRTYVFNTDKPIDYPVLSDLHGSMRTIDAYRRILCSNSNLDSSLIPTCTGGPSSIKTTQSNVPLTLKKRTRSNLPSSDSDRENTTSVGRAVRFH